jgi:hypothetical protein
MASFQGKHVIFVKSIKHSEKFDAVGPGKKSIQSPSLKPKESTIL